MSIAADVFFNSRRSDSDRKEWHHPPLVCSSIASSTTYGVTLRRS